MSFGTITASCNWQYDALWHGQKNLTPRIDTAFTPSEQAPTPQPVAAPPEIIFQTSLEAKPLYMHLIGETIGVVPVVTDKSEKFLRPTLSSMLGPHSYLFAGEISACDHYTLKARRDGVDEEIWGVNFIVDCGLPLCFRFGPHEMGSRLSVPQFSVRSIKRGGRVVGRDAERGMWVAGLAELSCGAFIHGLHQRVKGSIQRMQVLGLNPGEEGFGVVHDAPFGYNTRIDPFLFELPYAFVTMDVNETMPRAYKPIPARVPESPAPDLS